LPIPTNTVSDQFAETPAGIAAQVPSAEIGAGR
jgi:hypothetical protein